VLIEQHQSNITIAPKLPVALAEVPYMTLHVTLLATKAPLNCAYFNLTDRCPTDIATTLPEDPKDTPIFNSISHGSRLPYGGSVWKIFSPKLFTDEILEQLFPGAPVDWIYRKEWKAYPRLDPIETFAPVELVPGIDSCGLWYTSGIESFISTMETSALSGRNVAGLIAQRLFGNKITLQNGEA
jgi:prenylcysteine oxidase / farnesylcysteine lyase